MMDMTVPLEFDGEHRITDVEYFEPDETIITTLKRASVNSQNIRVKQNECEGDLWLLGRRREYFSSINNEKTFFTAPASSYEVKVFDYYDPLIPAEDDIGRDIDELMWKVAFFCSRGRLLAGCNPIDMVELDHWPNLSRLPHTVNAPRIAALLSYRPTTIGFAARLLKIPPEEAYQFYSAAYCAGMARPVNSSAKEPSLKPHRHQSLLSALWHKVSSL